MITNQQSTDSTASWPRLQMASMDSLPSIAAVTQSANSLTVVASKWPSLRMTSRNPLPLAAYTWPSLQRMISMYRFLTLVPLHG